MTRARMTHVAFPRPAGHLSRGEGETRSEGNVARSGSASLQRGASCGRGSSTFTRERTLNLKSLQGPGGELGGRAPVAPVANPDDGDPAIDPYGSNGIDPYGVPLLDEERETSRPRIAPAVLPEAPGRSSPPSPIVPAAASSDRAITKEDER